jgi:hypothetical protein
MKYWRTRMSGTSSSTSLPSSNTAFGSSAPLRPWRSASTQSACHSSRMSRFAPAAAESEFHWVRYCCSTRTGGRSPLDFSNVMPAAPKPVAGTVSP